MMLQDSADPNAAPAATPMTYSPEFRHNAGVGEAVAALFREIGRDRWRIWESFKRNFRANYAETVAGISWSVILPLVPIGVYVLLASMRVVARSDEIPFVLYITLGVTIYGLATAPIQDTMGAIRGEAGLLSKTNVGFITVVLSRFAQLCWDTAIRLILIVGIMAWLGVVPGLGVLWFPLAILPVLVFGLSVGVLMTILNTVAKDVANIVGIVIRYGFFFSSVIFPLPQGGATGQVMNFNPFNTFVVEIRNLIVLGRMDEIGVFLATTAVTLVLFLLAAVALYRSEPWLRASMA